MSDKKETAVGWLIDKLNELEFDLRLIPNHIKQANEMFERQIIEAYIQGFSECDNAGICACEKYYKETYNNIQNKLL
jgi:hypothetical protein